MTKPGDADPSSMPKVSVPQAVCNLMGTMTKDKHQQEVAIMNVLAAMVASYGEEYRQTILDNIYTELPKLVAQHVAAGKAVANAKDKLEKKAAAAAAENIKRSN